MLCEPLKRLAKKVIRARDASVQKAETLPHRRPFRLRPRRMEEPWMSSLPDEKHVLARSRLSGAIFIDRGPQKSAFIEFRGGNY